jgi:hypothetical protein
VLGRERLYNGLVFVTGGLLDLAYKFEKQNQPFEALNDDLLNVHGDSVNLM